MTISRYICIVKTTLKASFSALRPKQWIKNVLLFVAPFAAGVSIDESILKSFLAFIVFSVASSIGYIINDLHDLDADRKHAVKRSRSFASGALSFVSGVNLIIFLLGLLLALTINMPSKFNFCVLLYIFNTLVYSLFFKKVPVIEIFLVALGFVLRLVAGALVLNLAISEWFLIVGGFGAFFVVAQKRLAELKNTPFNHVRSVVNSYNTDFLNFVSSISVAVCLTGYSFWAFTQESNSIWYQISILPFSISLFRYKWISDFVDVEAPEDAILQDRVMLSLFAFSILPLAIAIY
jgi:decaprenyl-phosphate phosphoribosyltransferase